jgi:hypothetical protein
VGRDPIGYEGGGGDHVEVDWEAAVELGLVPKEKE